MAAKQGKKSYDNTKSKNAERNNHFEKIKREIALKKSRAENERGRKFEAAEDIKKYSIETMFHEEEFIEQKCPRLTENVTKTGYNNVLCEKGTDLPADFATCEKDGRRKEKDEETNRRIKLVVFRVGGEEFALPLLDVIEIIRTPAMIKVPNASKYIAGLCSVRGEILAVIDSYKWLGLQGGDYESALYDENSRIIVADIGGMKAGLLADKVSEVISAEEVKIKEPPAGIKAIEGGLVRGIFMHDNGKRLIMVIDAGKIYKAGMFSRETERSKALSNSRTVFANEGNANEGNTEDTKLETMVVFRVREEEYGIRIRHAQEINRMSKVVRFPAAPGFIDGMVNLRGEMIPLLNLRTLLEIPCNDVFEDSRYIVAEYEKRKIGIRVDSVSGVVKFPVELLEEVPEITVENNCNKYIEAIVKLDGGRVVLLLDMARVLSF